MLGKTRLLVHESLTLLEALTLYTRRYYSLYHKNPGYENRHTHTHTGRRAMARAVELIFSCVFFFFRVN